MKLSAVVAMALLTAIGTAAGGSGAIAAPSAPARQQTAKAAPATMTPEALDRLLAPIALYPDQLLAQMLLCAANPAKVQELSGWLVRNKELQGTELQNAAQKAGFEPSFVVLALFPQVVNYMADNVAWTKELGQAFSTNRQGVLDSVQRLRAQCQKAGNLKSTPQQEVETKKTSTGEQVIVIEPTNPQVVYVPQYNPQVVYTQPASTTVVVKEEDNDSGAAVAGAVVGFAAGIAIGAAMDNDYYYGPYGWHGGPYMYNDAWDDFYDDREDAREDWYENREDARDDLKDNRENIAEERTDRAGTAQEQRTERQQNRTENPQSQAQRDERRTEAQSAAQARGAGTASAESRGTATASAQSRGTGSASAEARGTTQRERQMATDRSGTRSDAFSGYSSGKTERSASSRGQRSRSSSGGRSRRR